MQDCLPAIENQEDWDREIAQCLKGLATLAGGLDLVPSLVHGSLQPFQF